MADRKGFFSRLFSHDDKESHELIPAEKDLSVSDSDDTKDAGSLPDEAKALSAQLKDEYGIRIFREETAISDLVAKGYHKMGPDAAGQADSFFQFVPQLATALVKNNAFQQKFMEATKDTYKVLLDPGTILAQSKKIPGGLAAVELDAITNKAGVGSPVLLKNNAQLTLPSGPDMVLGAFNIVSMVSGQYFMAQINGKLEDLKDGVNQISQFLEMQKDSELNAAIQEIEDIIAKLEFIKKDPVQVLLTINQLHDIQRIAQSNIIFCKDWVAKEMNRLTDNDKLDDITKHLDTIGKYMLQYRTAVQLFSVSILLEVRTQNIIGPEDLELFLAQMDQRLADFEACCENVQERLTTYLDANHVLNDPSLIQQIVSAGSEFVTVRLPGLVGLTFKDDVKGKVDNWFSQAKRQQKKEKKDQAASFLDVLSDMHDVEAPRTAIQKMITTMSNPIEFIEVDGEIYTNLPAVEE